MSILSTDVISRVSSDSCIVHSALGFISLLSKFCGIARILGILLVNSCDTYIYIFLATNIICSLSTLNGLMIEDVFKIPAKCF